jgi:hypothetical protein
LALSAIESAKATARRLTGGGDQTARQAKLKAAVNQCFRESLLKEEFIVRSPKPIQILLMQRFEIPASNVTGFGKRLLVDGACSSGDFGWRELTFTQ